MNILVDTHILLKASNSNLSPDRISMLTDFKNKLYISEISLWEFAKLHELKKIFLEIPLLQFLNDIYLNSRYEVVPLNPPVLDIMVNISPKMHRDPADQIIVASAIYTSSKLMTNDQNIVQSALIAVI